MRRRYGKQPRPTRLLSGRLTGLASRARARGCRGRAHSARGCVARTRSAALDRTFRGYPDDAAVVARVARSPLRAAFSVLPDASPAGILGSQVTAAGDRRSRVDRRPSRTRRLCCVGIALRGSRLVEPVDASSSACRGRAARGGVAQSHHGRRGRARPRAPLSPHAPHPAGRVADPHPSAHTLVRAGHAGAVLDDVQRVAGGAGAGRTRRGGAHDIRRRARLTAYRAGKSCHPPAPVRRLGRMRSRALPTRAGDRQRLPRCRGRELSGSCRVTAWGARSRWRTGSPVAAPDSGSC